MKSRKHGKNISPIEIHTSSFGIWMLVKDTEYFLPYKEFPWFADAKLSDIYDVKLLHNTHFYWPKLDVDLDVDSLINLEKYPLISHYVVKQYKGAA